MRIRNGLPPAAAVAFGFLARPCSAFPLLAGLLGPGSSSLAIALARYRWAFQFTAIVWLGVGFKLNVMQRTSLVSRIVYWFAVLLTVATVVRWGWWQF